MERGGLIVFTTANQFHYFKGDLGVLCRAKITNKNDQENYMPSRAKASSFMIKRCQF